MSSSYRGTTMEFFLDNNSLTHYGVLGMKWGVRNEDTRRKYDGPQGQVEREMATRIKRREKMMQRFGRGKQATASNQVKVSSNQQSTSSKQETVSQPESTSMTSKKPISDHDRARMYEKHPKNLSDAELQTALNRMNNEILYKQRQQTLNEINKSKSQKRKEAITKEIKAFGVNILRQYARQVVTGAIDSKLSSSKSAEEVVSKVSDTMDTAKKAAKEAAREQRASTAQTKQEKREAKREAKQQQKAASKQRTTASYSTGNSGASYTTTSSNVSYTYSTVSNPSTAVSQGQRYTQSNEVKSLPVTAITDPKRMLTSGK